MKVLIKDFALFTDVSVSPGLKLGVGAYVIIPASFLEASSGVIGSPEITGRMAKALLRKTEGEEVVVSRPHGTDAFVVTSIGYEEQK